MKNKPVSTATFLSAFLMGVILFLSFGKEWLDLKSALVFLAGLIGVGLSVLFFGIWNIRHSNRDN
ncbi:MAG: hypothetical protein QM730_21310 [Anaerolineales bacterium]